MPNASERRSSQDRRSAPRGGRRPDDLPGTTPLVLVVGHDSQPQRESEAILARLNFAVAPASGVAEALRVVEALNPDLVVAPPEEAIQLRASGSVTAPIVEFSGDDEADGLVEMLRTALRRRVRP